jgi:hypothetical protein
MSGEGRGESGEVMADCNDYEPANELRLPSPAVDFVYFFEQLSVACLLVRMQVMYNLATDELFSARTFRAHSATARLKAVAIVATAENLMVW